MLFDTYVSLLGEVGTRLGYGPVKPSEDGRAVLDFGEIYVSLSFDGESGLLSMTATVADLPDDAPRAVLEMLLENQYFLQKTHGAALSISKAYHCILAHLNLYIQVLDADRLFNAIENLVETSVSTRDEYEKIMADAAQALPETELSGLELINSLSV